MTSLMHREIRGIPDAVDSLLSLGASDIRRAAEALRATDPCLFITVARGSSDHVATYFKYSSELLLGIPVASVGPSVASIYGRPLRLRNAACLAVSQSGRSPDIVAMARAARDAGALTLALTNDLDADLGQSVAHPLSLHAGTERSVAATKTFVTSAVAAVWLLAELAQDDDLLDAIKALPEVLHCALAQDWSPVQTAFEGRNSAFCLGRGPAYAISNECALKLKETCLIHAESYSSAEVLHGPVSIVEDGFPVLALTAADAAEPGLAQVADDLAGKGARVFATTDQVRLATPLAWPRSAHPLTDPLVLVTSFYAMVEALAVSRGIDVDAPRHLDKVTRTT